MIDQKKFFDNYNNELKKSQPKQKKTKRDRAQVNFILKEVGLPSAEKLLEIGLRRRDKLQWLEKKHQLRKRINDKSQIWFTRYHFILKTRFIKIKRNINYFNFSKIIKKRLKKIEFKLNLKKRLIIIKVNQKYKRYQYRKSREERSFLKLLILNLNQQITYPFFRSRLIRLKKLTKPLKPVILTRRRFLQPVFIRLQHQLQKPHNGLRLIKKRRV